jgi:hypothetical protein
MATIQVTRRTFVVQASTQQSALSIQPPNNLNLSAPPRLRGEIGGRA